MIPPLSLDQLESPERIGWRDLRSLPRGWARTHGKECRTRGRELGLSPSAYALAVLLVALPRPRGCPLSPGLQVSRAWLARRTGFSLRQVDYAHRELEARGLALRHRELLPGGENGEGWTCRGGCQRRPSPQSGPVACPGHELADRYAVTLPSPALLDLLRPDEHRLVGFLGSVCVRGLARASRRVAASDRNCTPSRPRLWRGLRRTPSCVEVVGQAVIVGVRGAAQLLEPEVVTSHFPPERSSSLAVASALLGALGAPSAVVHAASGHAVGARFELRAPARQKRLRGKRRAELEIERAAASVADELDELEHRNAGSAAVAWPDVWARADELERQQLLERFAWRKRALAERIEGRALAAREDRWRVDREHAARGNERRAELERLRAAHAASVARGLERFA